MANNVIYELVITTNPVFEIVVNNGAKGEQGIQGISGVDGQDGADGEGVPNGGFTNQYLVKLSATDYDTSWKTVTSDDVAYGDGTTTEGLDNRYTKSATDLLLLEKVDKVIGKGLSTEDYTTSEKSKLSGIEAGANLYVHPSTHSADIIVDGTTNHVFTALDDIKLSGIETGAEVNNISDVNATDLTDGGDSTLHYHSADRYTLPAATDTVLGGVKVGSRLSIADGVLSADVQTTDISGKVDKVAGSSLVADTTVTDLTDGGDSSGHYHSSDRNVDNHTTGTNNKLFTAADKTKLDGIAAGAVKITISADAPSNPNTNDLWLDI